MTTPRDPADPNRLRGLTRSFPVFLGLRMVPIGALFLLIGIGSSPLGRIPTVVQGGALLLAVAATWRINLWYRRRFGVVEPARLGFARVWPIVVGLLLAVAIFGLGAPRTGGVGRLVLLLVLVLFGAAVLFALPRVFGAGAAAIALIASIAVVGAVAMLIVARDPLGFNALGAIFSLSVGATLCAAGVIEHRLLAGAMARPEATEDV